MYKYITLLLIDVPYFSACYNITFITPDSSVKFRSLVNTARSGCAVCNSSRITNVFVTYLTFGAAVLLTL
jgi:hypothetical protein